MSDGTAVMSKQCPVVGRQFEESAAMSRRSGVLDRKTRELLMVALACVFRCPHCTETHVVKALEAGASKAEVSEALLIAGLDDHDEPDPTGQGWTRTVFEKHLNGAQ